MHMHVSGWVGAQVDMGGSEDNLQDAVLPLRRFRGADVTKCLYSHSHHFTGQLLCSFDEAPARPAYSHLEHGGESPERT